MPDTLYLKKNDMQPYYYAQAKDSSGNPINLDGATILCSMGPAAGGTLKINRSGSGITIDNEASGLFHYAWQSGDTNATGKYYIEFEINPAAGGKFTIPAISKDACVVISDSLDAS